MPYDSEIIVIGCGNILFKDDGFGPILINILQKYFGDKKDYYDPAVTAYVEDEFDKDILTHFFSFVNIYPDFFLFFSDIFYTFWRFLQRKKRTENSVRFSRFNF